MRLLTEILQIRINTVREPTIWSELCFLQEIHAQDYFFSPKIRKFA